MSSPLLAIKNISGLTLMETTIALGILMIGVLASLTLMLSSFNYIQATEQEIVIVNLAREGIEIVRSMRNSESPLSASDVDLFDGSYDDASYIVDIEDTNSASSFNSNELSGVDNLENCTECSLYLKDGRYVHDTSGDDTVFKRMVTINPGASADEKIIVSEVSWTVKGKTHTYALESHLTNWQ